MKAELYDDRLCELGEGAFWHPERGQFFWFDIIGKRLLSREGDKPLEWHFERNVSAAGWIDRDTLLIAAAGAMLRFDIGTGKHETICDFEAARPELRSNDGRADLHGGFWIGTMGRNAEQRAGAVWRYHRGEMRKLFDAVSIPNAISFTPDGSHAHFADTKRQKVWRVRLGENGWPSGEPELFLNLQSENLNPDGAISDADGNLWVAQWGASRLACHGPDGKLLAIVEVEASQVSCPAFGGPDLDRLYITTARESLDKDALAREPLAGATFTCLPGARGIAEHRVLL